MPDQGTIGYAAAQVAKQVEQTMAPLDGVGDTLSALVQAATKPDAVKNTLSGAWLGHALHPVMTDLPIGFWTSALLLDLFGGRKADDATDLLLAAGNVSALGAAATGLADWSDSYGGAKRIGLAHASLNVAALTLFSGALLTRRAGARKTGTLLSLAGSAVASASAYLGGHLVYRRGLGTDHSGFESDESVSEWTDAGANDQLQDGSPLAVTVNDVPIMLVRDAGEVRALAERCNHAGGPLHEGEISGGAVTCPWHGSRFNLADGCVLRGPAAQPQQRYETKVENGRVLVRAG